MFSVRQVDGKDIHKAGVERTYLCRSTLLEAVALANAQLLPFWGPFFGIHGPDGRWPEAWWALIFVVNAHTQFWVHALAAVSYVTRTRKSTFLLFNWFGFVLMEIHHSDIELISCNKSWTGEYVTVTLTDESVRLRREHHWFKFLVWKNINFYPREFAMIVEDMSGPNSLAAPLGVSQV